MPVRPQLKSLGSPDLPEDPERPGFLVGLEDFAPADPRTFRILIDAEIGPEDSDGADVFSFEVSSPDSSTSRKMSQSRESYFWRERVLFMREWSYERLVRAVTGVISEAESSDWNGAARRLLPYMAWEFEDYRP